MSTQVKALFARIAGRYDLLNRLLSARRDVAWRDRALRQLRDAPGDLLDIACGTFDLGLQALALGKARRVHGCDFCAPMLSAGAAKRSGRPLTATVADALRLPYPDSAFATVTVAYGWRNFDDPAAALAEMRRVLAPGGQLLILEFFRPTAWWPRVFLGGFCRFTFPLVGGLVANDRAAYRYLHDSVQGFMSVAEAETAVAAAGFAGCRRLAFFGGLSHALLAEAPAAPGAPG